MPDLYQGAEGWDLSLVDPDNRRPVDYAWRREALEAATDLGALASGWRDGRLKQRVVATALDLRRRWPEVFMQGTYSPLEVEGVDPERVFAFLRRAGTRAVVIAAPLRCCGAVSADDLSLSPETFEGGRLILPPDLPPLSARDSFSGAAVEIASGLDLKALFSRIPLGLIELS